MNEINDEDVMQHLLPALNERLANMKIYDCLELSRKACFFFQELDQLAKEGKLTAFLEGFLQRKINSGEIEIWKLYAKAKNNFFYHLIEELHYNGEDLTLSKVLDTFDELSRSKNILCSHIRNSIVEKQEFILKQIEKTTSSTLDSSNREHVPYVRSAVLNHIGYQIVGQAARYGTILIVYHEKQDVFTKKENPLKLDDFTRELRNRFGQQVTLHIITFDVSTASNEELMEVFNENKPTILIYDDTLHQVLSKDLVQIRADEKLNEFLNLRMFCSKIFGQYCDLNRQNKRFYAFCDGDFAEKYMISLRSDQAAPNNHASKDFFKFNWLLQRMADEKLVKMKPLPTPDKKSDGTFQKGLEEFHKNFSAKIINYRN